MSTPGAAAPQAPAEPSQAEPSQAAPATAVHYAFAPHLARAELRRGDAQLFDYGVPGDAKQTLGGWLTFSGESRKLGDVRAMFVRGSNVKLALPADSTRQDRLTLRLRSFRRAPVTLYLNGETLADRKLDGKDFETLVLTLAPGKLRAGENQLELRVAGAGDGFAIDWIELAQRTSADAAAPPSPSELLSDDTRDELRVPAGVSVGYALEVPQDAALSGSVRAQGSGKLRVTAVRDAGEPLELATIDASAEAAPFRVELGRLAGQVARIELAALGAELRLTGAAVRVSQPMAATTASPKPVKNVIVFLIDTLRADKLAAYNTKSRVRTPNTSRFLRKAAVMLDARAQENWTKPSVATLLSSLYPWQHATYTGEAKLPDDVNTLPERLRKLGYFTGAFIANGYVSDKFGFQQGFTTYRNYVREGRRNVAQYVAADVLEWLDERPKDKPFFLYVHTIDPHVPYMPPKSFLEMYDPLPYTGKVEGRDTAKLLEHVKIGRFKPTDRDKEHLIALYDGEISYHDVHLGSVIDGLDKRGLADDTMVVITADHGEEFWEHGSVGHGHSIYDELLHVPLLVRVPGVTEGESSVHVDVGLVDVVPTIYDVLGLPMPSDLSGTSFLPELRGEAADAPRATVSGFMTAFRTLVVDGVKLVQHGAERMTLYDVRKDAGETTDVAASRPVSLRYARALLGLTLSGRMRARGVEDVAAPAVHRGTDTVIDSATEAQLRALGYVGSSRR